MTPDPKRKRADEMIGQIDKRAALRKHEDLPPVFAEMQVQGKAETGLRALVRNALAGTETERPTTHVKVVGAGSLEKDGCDFLRMASLCLEILGCPANARDFVLAVCALSGGDYSRRHIMTDAQIAQLIGYDRKYVKEKRETLIEWMEETNTAVLDIKENPRDHATKQYLPTEYRARIVPVITRFIQRARMRPVSSTHHAHAKEVETGFSEMKTELLKEAPTHPLIERREERRGYFKGNTSGQQMTLMGGQREQLIRNNIQFIRRSREAGHNPLDVWKGIQSEVADALLQMTNGEE